MAGESVTVSIAGLADARSKLTRLAKIVTGPRLMAPALTAMGLHMATRTAKSMQAEQDPVTGSEWPKSNKADGKTLFSSGALQRAVVSQRPQVSGLEVSLSLSRNSPVGRYAFIHQYGGTIKPKNAKFLAVPLSKSAKRAKSARRFIKQQGKKAFFVTSKNGNRLIATRRGKSGIFPHFVLLDSVTMPQRRFLGFTQNDSDARVFSDIIMAHLERSISAMK